MKTFRLNRLARHRQFAFVVAVAAALVIAPVAQAQDGMSTEELIQKLGLIESPTPVRDFEGWSKPERVVVMVDSDSRLDWLRQEVQDVELIPMARGSSAPDMENVSPPRKSRSLGIRRGNHPHRAKRAGRILEPPELFRKTGFLIFSFSRF